MRARSTQSGMERQWRRALICTAAALFALCVHSDVRAQGDDAAKRQARRYLASGDEKLQRGDRDRDRGRQEQAEQNWERALRDYEAAYQAYRDVQILFPIAQAETRLGRYHDAYLNYRELMAADAISEELRTLVTEQLSSVRRKLGALRFKVTPKRVLIAVDGEPIGAIDDDGRYYLPPGKHSVRVTRAGYETVERTVQLSAGKELVFQVDLARKGAVVEAEPEPDEEGGAERTLKPMWLAIAGGGVLLTTAVITGSLARSEHRSYSSGSAPIASRESARKRGRALAITTDVFLVGAIAAGGYAAYYYFKVYRQAEDADEEGVTVGPGTDLWVSPYFGQGGGGLAAGVRF